MKKPYDIINRAIFKAKQEIMAQEDAEIFAALDAIAGEGSAELIRKDLMRCRDDNAIREYIYFCINQYRSYNNLRKAIQEICPSHEDTLDKLLALK